ncbi:MAG: inositol monophosphatase family protein, partial [Nanoarchaeota archaeon]
KDFGSYKRTESSHERLKVSLETNIKNVQIATDLSYAGRVEKLRKMSGYAQLPFYCPMFGSASYSMCKVADGSLGGYVIFDVNINDIFTGPLLITEAGGIVSDDLGGSITRKTRTLVAASNKEIHSQLLDVLKGKS